MADPPAAPGVSSLQPVRPGGVARSPYSYRHDDAVPRFADDKPIIVFDGLCALCSGWVGFVLRHDRRERYRLLAAQSPLGAAIYRHYGLAGADYDSNILIENGVARIKSDGTLRMIEGLGLPWSMAGAARLLPTPWLDRIYDLIARNRLAWFGRREVCYAPPPGFERRFL